jgi:hypothetical protein
MKREIPAPTIEYMPGWNPWTQNTAADRNRPQTPVEALLQCAPGDNPDLSVEELAELRTALADAFDQALTEEERWVVNATVIARTSLRKMGVPKTTVARVRDNALEKLRNHLKENPVIVQYLERHKHTNIELVAGKHVYLAGPMRGHPNFNFPAFRAAREWLRDRGINVNCPAENDEQNGLDFTGMAGTDAELAAIGFDLEEAFARGVEAALKADCVVVLPGWETSEGSRLEMAAAMKHGKPVFTFSPSGGLNAQVVRRTSATGGVWEVRPL